MGEADSWFTRNRSLDYKPIDDVIINWLKPMENSIRKMIEVGCGDGNSLNYLSKNLSCLAYGVEPSKKAVNHIKKRFKNFNIKNEYADNISFEKETFDYVHLGFFMYLVDRHLFLKTISEVDRILKFGGYLSIIDFDVPYPYSNDYSHKLGVFAHKINNSNVFVSSGFYSIVNKFSFSHHKLSFEKEIDERLSLILLYKENQIFKGTKK